MPRVPTYDELQVGANTLPQANAQPIDAGRGLRQTGDGLQRSGDAAGQAAAERQKMIDQTLIADAMNKAVSARNFLTYDKDSGYAHLKGEAALRRPNGKSLIDEYDERLRQHLDGIESELLTDPQRIQFRAQASQLRRDFVGNLMRHSGQEFHEFSVRTQDGTIATARDQMTLSWGDAAALEQSRNAIKAAVYEKSRLLGLPAAQVEVGTTEALSPAHASVIAQAADAGKLDYAREYLKQVEGELTARDKLQITKILDAGDFEQRTQDGALGLYTKHKGDAAAALAEARTVFSGKDEDAVVRRIKEMDAEETALRERAQRDAGDKAWSIYAQTGSLGKIPPSLMAAMDGKDLVSMREAARRAADVKAGKVDKTELDTAFYELLADDDSIARLSKPQIATFRAQGFSNAQVGQLMRRKEALEKDAEGVQIDKQQLDKALADNGVDLGTKGREARGKIQGAIEAEIYAEQKAKGRPLSRDEKQKIINRQFVEVDSHWKRSGGLLDGQTGTDKKRYWEVGNKASIVVPQSARQAILKGYQAAGRRAPSEDTIREEYLRGKQRGEW